MPITDHECIAEHCTHCCPVRTAWDDGFESGATYVRNMTRMIASDEPAVPWLEILIWSGLGLAAISVIEGFRPRG